MFSYVNHMKTTIISLVTVKIILATAFGSVGEKESSGVRSYREFAFLRSL